MGLIHDVGTKKIPSGSTDHHHVDHEPCGKALPHGRPCTKYAHVWQTTTITYETPDSDSGSPSGSQTAAATEKPAKHWTRPTSMWTPLPLSRDRLIKQLEYDVYHDVYHLCGPSQLQHPAGIKRLRKWRAVYGLPPPTLTKMVQQLLEAEASRKSDKIRLQKPSAWNNRITGGRFAWLRLNRRDSFGCLSFLPNSALLACCYLLYCFRAWRISASLV